MALIMSEPSALSLIPPAVVLLLAITLRRPILALVCGAASGLLLLSPQNALSGFAEISLKVMQDETIGWLILVCGSFGALIALLVRTGARWLSGVRRSRLRAGGALPC